MQAVQTEAPACCTARPWRHSASGRRGRADSGPDSGCARPTTATRWWGKRRGALVAQWVQEARDRAWEWSVSLCIRFSTARMIAPMPPRAWRIPDGEDAKAARKKKMPPGQCTVGGMSANPAHGRAAGVGVRPPWRSTGRRSRCSCCSARPRTCGPYPCRRRRTRCAGAPSGPCSGRSS